ncbi:MAG: hypothetical protein ABIS18_07350 [Actinomycetota bacterium]
MQIKDQDGKDVSEATLRMSKQEIVELLVATSEIDDGTADHAFMRDQTGRTLAVYLDDPVDLDPLERGTDWWIGLLILAIVLLVVVGAFTLARSVIDLLF